jgi:hypothetical protein
MKADIFHKCFSMTFLDQVFDVVSCLLCSASTVVKLSTHKPKIAGTNHAREKSESVVILKKLEAFRVCLFKRKQEREQEQEKEEEKEEQEQEHEQEKEEEKEEQEQEREREREREREQEQEQEQEHFYL